MQKEQQIKLLKELVEKVAGKNAEAIVPIIATGKHVNEFKIAEKLKLSINQTRNILYKLSAQNIVFFARKKDARKGWYIYSWSINFQKALERLKDIKHKDLVNIQNLIRSREQKRFYVCPSGCMELSEESAMLHEFRCPECGQLLEFKSSAEEVAELKMKLKKVESEMKIIKEELAKIYHEKERKAIKEMEKKKKEKQEKRKMARKKRMREKKRLLKKEAKLKLKKESRKIKLFKKIRKGRKLKKLKKRKFKKTVSKKARNKKGKR